MAIGDLITSVDVKLQLGISGVGDDSMIDQIVERVSHRFVGDLGLENLISATYTAEKHNGNGLNRLYVRNWPVTSVTAASIEDESSIDPSDDDVLRIDSEDWGLVLVARYWSKPTSGTKVNNVSVTYVAGYTNIAAFEIAMPDAHEMLIGAAVQRFRDLQNLNAGVKAQAHMDGSVTYFDPATLGKSPGTWKRSHWEPVVHKYRRRRI